MKKIAVLIVTVFFLGMLSSCKQYETCPAYSKATKATTEKSI